MAFSNIFAALFENYFIKLIFLTHATFMAVASVFYISSGGLITFTSYNLLFLISVLLAVLVDKNADMALLAAGLDAICIGLDILLLIAGGYIGFIATLFVVFNLVVRPASTILLLRNYSTRAGIDDPTSGLLEVSVHASAESRPRSAYQNIDEPNQTLP